MPLHVPLLPWPEISWATVPVPSSSGHQPTKPDEMVTVAVAGWRWEICRFGVARRFGVIAGLWLLAELGVRLRLVVVGNFTWSRGRIGRGRIRDIGSIGSVGGAGRIGGTGGLRFAGGLCCLGAIVLRRGPGQIRLRRCRGLAGGSRRRLRGLRGWSLRAAVEQAVERRFARARGTCGACAWRGAADL